MSGGAIAASVETDLFMSMVETTPEDFQKHLKRGTLQKATSIVDNKHIFELLT